MSFPASISLPNLQLNNVVDFLNESNRIEGIHEIHYSNPLWQNKECGHFGAFILSQSKAMTSGEQSKLSFKDIKKWQELITREQIHCGVSIEEREIGTLRQHNVRIGQHTPPDFSTVPLHISFWMEDFNQALEENKELMATDDEAFTRIAGGLFQRFEAIHPFADGNGRVGRLLVNYMATLCKRPLVMFQSEMVERNHFYRAHRSKAAMAQFLADKIHGAVFAPGFEVFHPNSVSSSSASISS